MRIVYIITLAEEVGGAGVHVRDCATMLRERGHDTFVLVGGGGWLTDELTRLGVPFHSIPTLGREISLLRDLKAFRDIRRHLRDLRPDIISCHSSKAGILGRIAGRFARTPTLFTAHGWAFTEGVGWARWPYLAVEWLAASLAAGIITVSEYDRRLALRYRFDGRTELRTIRNGMPDVTGELLASPGGAPPRLVMIARYGRQKDHATLLTALGRLREREWVLDLVGEGPTLPQVQELAATLGLAERIRFLPARSDVPTLLSGSQIGLLISNWEGLPRSIIEEMRAGLPVVASNVGGTGELIRDGIDGYLVPRGDVEKLGDTLSALIDDADLRVRMGCAARLRYETAFKLEFVLDRLEDLYSSVGTTG